MKFGRVALDKAIGAVLGHSVSAAGTRFRKGRVLTADDTAALAAAGLTEVMAATLEDGDVAEDAAARRVAEALDSPGLDRAEAFTGRANLYAGSAGILTVDTAVIDAINGLDEGLTVATLAPYAPVAPRQMVATVKIIPFALPGAIVEQAVALARGKHALGLAPFQAKTAGLISTTLPGLKPSILDKTERALEARLDRLGAALGERRVVDHHEDAVAAALTDLAAAGCDPILVFGASAIVDRRDVVPAGIVRAGGQILHFGMPVDPGNLLALGRLDGRAVIGLPGCARSPKMNGFDWVLERTIADVAVDSGDLAAMGVGGLLKEIPSRPQPRDPAGTTRPAHAPRVAAVILAAGRSTRMGARNKLLAPVDGRPMVAHVAAHVRASRAEAMVAVVGHEAEAVRAALAPFGAMTVVDNPDYAAGLSTSLKAGIAALPDDMDAALVCLGDMPRVRTATLDTLIAALSPDDDRLICAPTFQGKRGNPVLWHRRFFPDLMAIAGDKGAKELIDRHGDTLVEVAVDDPGILLDVDTEAALERLDEDA